MRNTKRIVGITLLLVMAFMAFGATVVLAAPLAQTDEPAQVDPETEEGAEEAETTGRVGPCGVSREVMAQIIDREALQAATADALGMTVEELQAAKDSGQRLSEIAEAQDVTLEEIQTAVEAAKADMVQQALDDELITAEQAECILSHEGGLCGGGRGRGHGFRGDFGNGDAAPATEGVSLNA
jgi:hypothetical protein